jgi:RNA polymerase sigma-70 factor, ECF subfamily
MGEAFGTETERAVDPERIDALVKAAREGDRNAFMAIVEAYQRRVFMLAYSVLRDREDALDVVQETFLRFYRKADLYRPGNSFQGWLLRIAKNICVDHYRKNTRRRRELESPKSLDDLQLAAAPDPALAGAGEMREATRRCIDRLAGRQRLVFVLRHVDELQFNEISETMNISLGTAKSLHFKAIRNLRKWLTPYMGAQS